MPERRVDRRALPYSRAARFLLPLLFALLTAAIGGVTWRFYASQKELTERGVQSQLLSVADTKVREIVNWRKGRLGEARAITNRLAPEHLTVDAPSDLDWVQNAGSVFIGRWSAQPMGDYISGPNHTLPTGGMARVRGGLSVNDFVKLITVQEYTAQGIRSLGPPAALLAEAEGLIGHAEAIRTRFAKRPPVVGKARPAPHKVTRKHQQRSKARG